MFWKKIDEIPMTEADKPIVVCMNCMTPNDMAKNYCRNCRVALHRPISVTPVQSIDDEGFLLRKAADGRPKFIVVFGTWLLFFPWVFGTVAGGIFLISNWDGFGSFVLFLIGAALLLLAVQMLSTVTKNYLAAQASFDKNEQNKKLIKENKWRAKVKKKSR